MRESLNFGADFPERCKPDANSGALERVADMTWLTPLSATPPGRPVDSTTAMVSERRDYVASLEADRMSTTAVRTARAPLLSGCDHRLVDFTPA
jgi:hypothetical protein